MHLAGILSTTGYVLEVLIGVSLIIFVHEFGHFLAAKWAGVKVRRFFFGFAPVIRIGKRKITLQLFAIKKGDTKYGVGLLPFGGFVDMAGEQEGDEADDTPKEQQFTSKTPGQRAVIFVAGAVMNAIFAVVFFIVAFGIGVSFVRPTVGDVVPGQPAWQVGIEPGDKILEINGEEQKEFTEMAMSFALADDNTPMKLKIQRGDKTFDVTVTPVPDPMGRGMTIGIRPNNMPVVGYIQPGYPAEKAGLKKDDRITSIIYTDADSGKEVKSRITTYLDITKVVQDPRYIGKPVTLGIERGDPDNPEKLEVTLEPVIPREAPKLIGIAPPITTIAAIRDDSPAHNILQVGDTILTIGGKPFYTPDQIKQSTPAESQLVLGIERKPKASEEKAAKPQEITVDRSSLLAWLEKDIAFTTASPDEADEPVVGTVQPGMPAQLAGMKPGDRITEVDGEPVMKFSGLAKAIRAKAGQPVAITWTRESSDGEETFSATITPTPQKIGYIGIMYQQDRFIQRMGFFGAISTGFSRTALWGKRVLLIVKALFTSKVSPQHLAGPVGIFTISYAVTQYGVGTLLYFLAMISINLAILNIFPVPVLDGGHLLFLGIEKIKGSPVTIKTQVVAQTVGLVLLLTMAVFVTYNDIVRLIWGF
jgi:regulator of sigma E protease